MFYAEMYIPIRLSLCNDSIKVFETKGNIVGMNDAGEVFTDHLFWTEAQ
jgi:hypothetical protein